MLRSSGWLLIVCASCLWIAVVVLPLVSGLFMFDTLPSDQVPMIRPTGQLLLTTLGWSSAVALGAFILGIGPGLGLAGLLRSNSTLASWRRSCVSAFMVLLLLVP